MNQHTGVPPGYHTLQPYLMFEDTQAAIDFYVRAFSATVRLCMKDASGRVNHAEINIGDSVMMMTDENPQLEAYAPAHFGGSPVGLLLYLPDCDATYREALAAGAASKGEPADQPYGARMAGVVDPFGYTWYLSTHQRSMSNAELEAVALATGVVA